MPRHSPILQILVYFYSKQEKCNIYSYIYIYIYTKTPSPNKKGGKNNCTRRHYGIQRNFRSKPEKNTHTRKYYFTLVLNTVNVFKTECTNHSFEVLHFLICVSSVTLTWLRNHRGTDSASNFDKYL